MSSRQTSYKNEKRQMEETLNNQQTSDLVEKEFSDTDAEMARRLLSLKRTPSPALVARVRSISTLSQQQVWPMARWAWGVAATVVLLTVLVVTSPPVRAAIASLQEAIGDVYLTITNRSPDTSDARIIEPELVSLESAHTMVSFDFGIPSQVPDGWVMDEQVRVNDLGGGRFVEIRWTNPNDAGTGILFSARSALQPGSWLVSPDSFREIEIGGQPADRKSVV